MLSILVALPLLGFFVNSLWHLRAIKASGYREPENIRKAALVSGLIGSFAIVIPFFLGVNLFLQIQASPGTILTEVLFSWIHVAHLKLPFGFALDALSSLFVLIITGVGTLIHMYSIGYMHEDAGVRKFFAYLNLFCAAMLVLVLADNLALLFVGWEGVGLCSYCLIGFWYTDIQKAIAGKKAFVVNRIGDFAFILGCFWLFAQTGTLQLSVLKDLSLASSGVATWICLLFFVGCTGKSAQLPLFVWLPDAMAGPTPVSALIHAATMVTSGVYLISRLSGLFLAAPVALDVIAWVGVATALFSASIALFQDDIKKVLAYSTVSQLGFMFLACGVGAFDAAVFHVMTHAFFKALMFLGAGSVIHGSGGNQDMTTMGGLRVFMPKTALTFATGWLAISGIPPLSGFFSKDEILSKAFSHPNMGPLLWLLGLFAAFLTAVYMTRLMILTFLGQSRAKDPHHHKPHESPGWMIVPLMVLAVLAAFAGFLGVPHFSWLEDFLKPSLHPVQEVSMSGALEGVLMLVSTVVAGLGIGFAWKVFGGSSERAAALHAREPSAEPSWVAFLKNKWYLDECYQALFVGPIFSLCKALRAFVELRLIDAVVLQTATVSQSLGGALRTLQTGRLQNYLSFVTVGLLIAVGILIYGLAIS